MKVVSAPRGAHGLAKTNIKKNKSSQHVVINDKAVLGAQLAWTSNGLAL